MANVSVNFELLKDKHPSYRTIKSLINNIPTYVNETCAVQICYALNHSQAIINNFAYNDSGLHTGKVRAFQGNDNMYYIFAVPDIKVYLNNVYGIADNYKGTKQKIIAGITGKHGILAFGYRHIDIWIGDNIHRPSEYNMDYLWKNESVQKRGIYFWEVTSELGF